MRRFGAARGRALLSSVALVCLAIIWPEVAARPNFIIIMADDLGYNDLGYTNNPDIETPNLDQLASESVSFKNFYVNPTCAPTRAALLTGRTALNTGVWGVHGARDYLDVGESTFADKLREAGYKTGMFGKWHNGKTDGFHPWHRGFDEACKPDLYDYWDNAATCNGQSRWAAGWTIERFTDWAINFIERHANKQDFLMYFPLMTPHLGKTWYGESEYWHAPEGNVNKYRQKGFSDATSRLYGMIDFMDYNVGRIMWRLNDLGIADNTVVMYFSDNGAIGKSLVPQWEWERRNADSLKGNKGEVYENGIKSPFFVRWKSRFSPATVDKAIVQVEDIYPTVLELAGTSGSNRPLDGWSITSLLWNPWSYGDEWRWRTIFRTIESPEWTRANGNYVILPNQGYDKSNLWFGNQGRWAIRQGRWKYVNVNGEHELYDIWNDPSETTKVWSQMDKLWELHGQLSGWWSGVVNNPNSFGRPRFYIGWGYDSLIYTMGAFEASGDITVRSHNVEGWVNPGSYLKFRVQVLQTQNYNVKVSKWGSWQGDVTVNVVCNGQWTSTRGYVSGDYIGNIYLPIASYDCWVEFKIDSGSGWFAADIIRFQKA